MPIIYPFDYTPPFEELIDILTSAGWGLKENPKWLVYMAPPERDEEQFEIIFPTAPSGAWEQRHYAQAAMGIMDALGIIRVVHPDTNGWYLTQEVRPPFQQPAFVLVIRATEPPSKNGHPGEGVQIAFHNFKGFSTVGFEHLPDILQWQYLPGYPTGVKREPR